MLLGGGADKHQNTKHQGTGGASPNPMEFFAQFDPNQVSDKVASLLPLQTFALRTFALWMIADSGNKSCQFVATANICTANVCTLDDC